MSARLALFALSLTVGFANAGDWPQFRGPNASGVSDEKDLPTSWGPTENVKWKTPIHDKGWSSPVIWGDQIWLTTATTNGSELFVLTLDPAIEHTLATGQVHYWSRSRGELWYKGATSGQVALAWLLKRSPVMLPIPGTSRVAHLEQNAAAAAITLSDEEFASLDRR